MPKLSKAARNEEMFAKYEASKGQLSQSELAKEYDVSQSRVAQILDRERRKKYDAKAIREGKVWHRLDIEERERAALERIVRVFIASVAIDLDPDEPFARAILRRLQDIRLGFGGAYQGRAKPPKMLEGRRGKAVAQGFGRGRAPATEE